MACAGGPGSSSADYQRTQESAPAFFEQVGVLEEGAARSNESVRSTNENGGGGGGGTGGLDCTGTYACTISAGGQTTRSSSAHFKDGSCRSGDLGFEADGTIRNGDQVIGRWSLTSSGFRMTASQTSNDGTVVQYVIDCTRSSDGSSGIVGDDDDDDDDDTG